MSLRALAATAVLALLVAGCPDEDTGSDTGTEDIDTISPDAGDVGPDQGDADTGQPDGDAGPDGAGDADVAPGELAILAFESDFYAITSGTRAGETIEGSATLSWQTQGADGIELLADGVPVSLDGCTPASGSDCTDGGSISVSPTQERTFTLRATAGNDEVEEAVTITVHAPANVLLAADPAVAPVGTDVECAYIVEDAESFGLQIVTFDDEGAEVVVDCVAESDATGDDVCVLPEDGDGELMPAGTFVIADVQRGFILRAMASNGADDGIGDVDPADKYVAVTVPVIIEQFLASPSQALPGGSVKLDWKVPGADAVSVAADSEDVVGLATCVGLGAGDDGFCTVTIDANAALGDVTFTLTATQLGSEEVAEATAVVGAVAGPTVASFEAAPAATVPGGKTTLSWQVFASDAVAIEAAPAVVDGLDACTDIDQAGEGSCEVTVQGGASTGSVTFTLTASHTTAGPAATSDALLDVQAAPTVDAFDVDDATVEAGAMISLSWATSNADGVVVTEDSGAIPPGQLGACAGATGNCDIGIPAELEPGDITFSLVAVGPTGDKSAATDLVVSVGLKPEVTFGAAPDPLPQGGGDATLTWTAAGATWVVITDSADTPALIVDTDAGTLCDGGAACDPTGDAITVATSQPTTWTLTAENDFGVSVQTASVTIEGAPIISTLTMGGTDLLGGESAQIAGDTADLVWETANLDATDEVRLDRAPLPAPNGSCDAVAGGDWVAASGFPMTGMSTGSANVGGISAAAECFRFLAIDLDAVPSQSTQAVFKVRHAPAVDSFTSDDDTVRTGDPVTLTWSTTHAYSVAISAAPVGAVTAQQLADCNAANGSCELTIQPGTPSGDVTFSLAAKGEEGAVSDPMTAVVTVGQGAEVVGFSASPGSASETVEVTLSWTTTDGASLSIVDGSGAEVFASTDAAEIDAGAFTASIDATTSWTLTVTNAFGSDTAQAATFIGPSIDALSAAGGDALDGSEDVLPGDVTVAWSTTSADGSHSLQTAAPVGGGCADVEEASWTEVYFDDTPAKAASHVLADVTSNLCVRLVVENSETPAQTNSASFLLRDVPSIVSLTTSPDSIGANGGTIIVSAEIIGATSLSMNAQYLGSNGGVLKSVGVCNQGSLNQGSLTGGASVDQVECAHNPVPCNLLCLNNGWPSGTASIRYVLTVGDQEGDSDGADTSDGEDVDVN